MFPLKGISEYEYTAPELNRTRAEGLPAVQRLLDAYESEPGHMGGWIVPIVNDADVGPTRAFLEDLARETGDPAASPTQGVVIRLSGTEGFFGINMELDQAIA